MRHKRDRLCANRLDLVCNDDEAHRLLDAYNNVPTSAQHLMSFARSPNSSPCSARKRDICTARSRGLRSSQQRALDVGERLRAGLRALRRRRSQLPAVFRLELVRDRVMLEPASCEASYVSIARERKGS